jgi:paraquat-inducible protein A
MLALAYLLVSVHRRSTIRRRERALLYRVTELIGRWSMVDVFVVAVLAALVQMGNLASILPGPGAGAFAGVVVLSMLAASAFDPRLIWDHQEHVHG